MEDKKETAPGVEVQEQSSVKRITVKVSVDAESLVKALNNKINEKKSYEIIKCSVI